MNLTQLIYISTLDDADESVIASIHSHAVRNNTAKTVTGKLLYYKGRFMQVLEGDEKVVRHIFDKIKHDPRHTRIELVMENPIEERAFPHWNMSFKHLQEADLVMWPVYKTYLEADYTVILQDPQTALHILKEEI